VANSNEPSVQKRINFLGTMIGVLLALVVVMVAMAFATRMYVLIAVAIGVALAAIPVMKRFGELKAQRGREREPA
jgi:TctA family transporter